MVTKEQNTEIMKIPTEEEVRSAIIDQNRNSAGGPDGMTGAFYQDAWDIIKMDI